MFLAINLPDEDIHIPNYTKDGQDFMHKIYEYTYMLNFKYDYDQDHQELIENNEAIIF